MEVIANNQGKYTTPSYAAFTKTEHLVRDSSKSQATMNKHNTIFDAKYLIERNFTDTSIHSDMNQCPLKIVARTRGKPIIEIEYKDRAEEIQG